MPRTRSAHTTSVWERMTAPITPELRAEHPAIESSYTALTGYLVEIYRLSVERDFYEARKQEATQKINAMLKEGRRSATLLQLCLRHLFGNRNPALIQFGIRPFHRRKHQAKGEESRQDSAAAPGGSNLSPSGGTSS